MSKKRYIDRKKSKVKNKTKIRQKDYSVYASKGVKTKAFLTDSFMLFLPIIYVVIYLIMDGREDFASQRLIGWVYIAIPLILVETIFIFKTGQTPGYRAYNIEVVDEATKKRPSIWVILFRNFSVLLSVLTFFGWTLMFVRKDHKTLHDLLSATAVVYIYK